MSNNPTISDKFPSQGVNYTILKKISSTTPVKPQMMTTNPFIIRGVFETVYSKTWYGTMVWYVLWYGGMVRIPSYHGMHEWYHGMVP